MTKKSQVFLNVPYDSGYEKLLVALVATVVANGGIPRMTLEVPDGGQGRLKKLYTLLKNCDVSFHDLSRIGVPTRFNMPFELGIAVALQIEFNEHDYYVLEKEPFQTQKRLSDINLIDPIAHGNSSNRLISGVSGFLENPDGDPPLKKIENLTGFLILAIPELKERNLTSEFFNRRVFQDLVALTITEAQNLKLLK